MLAFVLLSVSACSSDDTAEDYSAADVGSYIKFGTYEQDNKTANGSEPIQWLVLAKEDSKLLVISRYILDWQQFGNEETSLVTWENSSLRNWLNSDFFDTAFSDEEKTVILSTEVMPDENLFDGIDQGSVTSDKLFILSASEINAYFLSDSERTVEKTKYVKDVTKGLPGYWSSDTNCWWSRTVVSPGLFESPRLAVVNDDGIVDDGHWGSGYNYDNYMGVRPTLWIALTS